MNTITNYSLTNSPNFGNAKKQAAEKAVSRLDKALSIAYRNPKTHTVTIDEVPDEFSRKAVYIMRNSGGKVRTASYRAGDGKLTGITHESFNDRNGIVSTNQKGYLKIKDSVNNDKHWFGKYFTSFKDFIAYFREELPILRNF